ncbi:MAG: ankyrin [uncultured bacterium]|nr:MAG: ankyrin [uncultured bacterium]
MLFRGKSGLVLLLFFAVTMGVTTLNARQPDFNCQAAKEVQAVMERLKNDPDSQMMATMLETAHKGHPFILAIRLFRDDLVAEMIEAGFDPKFEQSNGDYPLDVAISGWSPGIKTDVIVRLLEAGVDVNRTDKSGVSSLHYASMSGHSDVVSLLLKHGANPDLPTTADVLKKWTPLHCAVKGGKSEIVAMLLAGGGDPHLKNGEGVSPLEMAKANNSEDLVKMLSDAKPKGNGPSPADNVAPTEQADKTAEIFQKAMTLAKEKKLSEALPLFEVCYKADSKNDNYAYYLALAQATVGKTDEAGKICAELLQRNPGHKKAASLIDTLKNRSK